MSRVITMDATLPRIMIFLRSMRSASEPPIGIMRSAVTDARVIITENGLVRFWLWRRIHTMRANWPKPVPMPEMKLPT